MNPIGGPLQSFAQARSLGLSQRQRHAALEALATGLRINRAGDDPAGLVSSEQIRVMLAELEAQSGALERNRGAAAAADRSLGEIGDLLIQAEALAVASASTGGLSQAEREANQMELGSILSAVDRAASASAYRDTRLLRGGMSLTVGGVSLSLPSAAVTDLGSTEIDAVVYTLADVASGGPLAIEGDRVRGALEVIRAARREIVSAQAEVGAFARNVIHPRGGELSVAIQGLMSAESSIRDTDGAKATAALARLDILESVSLRTATAGVGTGGRSDPRRLIRLPG